MFSFSSLASSLKKGHLSAFEIWWPALVKRQNIYHKRLEVFQCYQPLAIKILVISTNPKSDDRHVHHDRSVSYLVHCQLFNVYFCSLTLIPVVTFAHKILQVRFGDYRSTDRPIRFSLPDIDASRAEFLQHIK